jgi:recombination protein RecA
MLYIPLETIEDIFEAIENIIETIRKSSKDRLVTIVVDSVSAATTKIEQDADYDKDGWATAKAIVMSKAMRKITNIIGKQRVLLLCASQLREKMGVMFGDKYTTSGGKALGFHASCRIRLKGIGKLKSGSGKTEQIVGVQTEAQVIKNRMGPPFKKATFDIYFNSGIDDQNSWLSLMKDYNIVSTAGAYYTLINEDTGESIRFMARDWKGMLAADPSLKDYCYRKICDIFIMKYKDSEPIDPDQISVDDDELSE